MQGCKKISVVEIWWLKLHLNRAHTVRFFQSFTVFVHDPNEIWGKSPKCDVISHIHIIAKSLVPMVPLTACTSGHTDCDCENFTATISLLSLCRK